MATSWPLVGRRDELERVARALARSRVGGAVVTGPAGAGKSRFVSESLALAPPERFSVYRATATRAGATIPLAALAHLLPDEQGDRQADLLRRTARGLVARAHPRRVVVAVDDAHLLDDASAALVHHLATASPAFVLAAVRDDEPAPDAVRQLSGDDAVERVGLSPVPAEAVGEALRGALGDEVSGAVVHHLTELAGGNPSLMTELVEAALAGGHLVRRAGLWRFAGPCVSARDLPRLVRDRLSRLPPEVYAAAELLALAEPLGAAELEGLLSPDVISTAEREGVFAAVRSERRQQVGVVHPLYGEALRAAAPPLRARACYRALADAVAATGARRRGDVLRLALWRLRGGRESDPGLLLQAARTEEAVLDRAVAERLAHAAEDAGGGLSARMARVDALRWQGRAEEAAALLAEAEAGCPDVEQRCAVAGVRASNLYYGLNRTAAAEEVLTRTRTRAGATAGPGGSGSTRELCSDLDDTRAGFLFSSGSVGDAAELALDVLARPDLGPRTQLTAACHASMSLSWAGRPDLALRVVQRTLQRRGEAGEESHVAVGELLLLSRCLAHLHAGRPGVALQLATSRYQYALRSRAEGLQGPWALALGQLSLHAGRIATARRWLHEATVTIDQRSPIVGRYGIAHAHAVAAEAAALSGDLPAAGSATAQADGLLPAGALVCHRERGPTWAAATRGELSTARDLAMSSADRLAAVGARFWEAMALHDVARLGAPHRVAERLRELAESSDGRLGALYARHAEALTARDASALEEAAAGFSTCGATLLAAEAAAAASGAHRDAGRRTRALAAAERSRELAARCEGARTPALALAGDPLPLTPREREVAALAAGGLPDRGIAERLVLSERTVHNHLHRTYGKLGIDNRRQLRTVLRASS